MNGLLSFLIGFVGAALCFVLKDKYDAIPWIGWTYFFSGMLLIALIALRLSGVK